MKKKLVGKHPSIRKKIKKPARKLKPRVRKHANKVWISQDEFNFLNNKLMEAQETLDAIRTGVVDAVVVSGPRGNQVYSLAGAEQPYRVYVEQMQEGAVTVTSGAMILYCNRRFAGMLRTPLERVISSDLTTWLEQGCWEKISGVFSSEGKVIKYETVLHCRDGSGLPVLLTASRLPIEDQEVMCLVITDSSEQKEKAELRLAKEVAEKANTAKDAFLAALSHELRTPLNPILLMASEGAENPDWPANARSDFASIRDNIELEARLIDDLLDLTRITHGKLTMDIKSIEADSVLEDAIRIVRPELDSKRISLTVALQAGGAIIRGDGIRLQQVFWNILRNAIKFTPERGSITLTTRKESDRELSVTISDTGIGMKAEELKRVFEIFAQGDHRSSHRFGGLGLGLAISRKLVELHAGSIQAFSDGPNLGATFVVCLPLAKPEDAAAAPKNDGHGELQPLGALASITADILLVEDHEQTRLTLARLLTRRNYHVTTASSVSEALALAQEHKFDLVISDIGLPDGDGFQLMKELCKSQNIKGIALTGYGMEHDIERSMAAGFVAHLTKPVRVQSLEMVLAKLIL